MGQAGWSAEHFLPFISQLLHVCIYLSFPVASFSVECRLYFPAVLAPSLPVSPYPRLPPNALFSGYQG